MESSRPRRKADLVVLSSSSIFQWSYVRLGLMVAATIVIFFIIIGSATDQAEAADAVPRLQIGVKKRVENCSIKTKKGDLLHIHYTGSLLEDGSVFDSSYDRGQPLTFTLGAGQVIKGWDQGHLGMCEGEKRKLVIPPELGYGTSGAPPKIPANAVLIFETELVQIERRSGDL